MRMNLSKVLDECLVRVRNGEAIETCLAEYPHERRQLEPLLYTAMSTLAAPKESPSEEFRSMTKASLLARLQQESIQAKADKSRKKADKPKGPAPAWQRLVYAFAGEKKFAIAITVTLLLVLVGSLFMSGTLNFQSPPSVLVSTALLLQQVAAFMCRHRGQVTGSRLLMG
jgi:hypothetical protein